MTDWPVADPGFWNRGVGRKNAKLYIGDWQVKKKILHVHVNTYLLKKIKGGACAPRPLPGSATADWLIHLHCTSSFWRKNCRNVDGSPITMNNIYRTYTLYMHFQSSFILLGLCVLKGRSTKNQNKPFNLIGSIRKKSRQLSTLYHLIR